MRISLGTIELNDRQREAIGHYYGQKIASRETCRNYILDNGLGSIDDQLALLDEQEDDRSNRWGFAISDLIRTLLYSSICIVT